VFIHYCSSDIWSGIAPAQDGTSYMPPFFVVEKTFTIRFEGHSILQAAIGLLRKDGVTPLTFTLEGNNVAMPDLDDATGTVVIAGGSAGGSGVERQLDRVVQQLIANHNPDKTLPFYAGFIDSAFAPKLEGLGFQLTSPCTDDNRCDWRGYVEDTQGYYPHTTDTSCAAMHPTELYKCTDTSHLVRNHLTTPFFIRQGQTDSLLSSKYENEWKLATSPASTATAPMTVDEFASQVRAQARTIPTWNSIAEEPPGKLPGSFVPLCSTHDPLRDRAALFDTTIDGWTWGQVWANWLTTSATPRRIIGDPAIGVVSVCK
jgi:hypothetical protein